MASTVGQSPELIYDSISITPDNITTHVHCNYLQLHCAAAQDNFTSGIF